MLAASLVAALVPLVSLVILPNAHLNRAPASTKSDVESGGQQAPVKPGKPSVFQARVDSVMGYIERSVEHLPSFPRLHPQECVKRSICEAHNKPDKYGAIGFMLRILFP